MDDDNNSLTAQAGDDNNRTDSPLTVNPYISRPAIIPRPLTVDLVDDDEETEPQFMPDQQPHNAMEPSTPPGDEEPKTFIKMDDNQDCIIWNDEYFFEMSSMKETKKTSSAIRVWKDAEWSLLVIINPLARKFGVFLGIEDASKLPSGWKLRTRFRFALLDENDVEMDVGSIESHDFKRSTTACRDDFGHFTYFTYEKLEKCFVDVDGATFVQLKIQVIHESTFLPAAIPASHNSKQSTNMVGLANLGATCYLNSLLQMLYHINSFRKAVYQLPHEQEEDPRHSTTLALQALFKNLQFSNSEVSTKDLTLSFGWTTNEAFMQQDVQEMMRILLDRLEDKMKGSSVDGLIKDLFCGKVRSYIRCMHVNYESKREEDFYDIQLDVKGCQTIYESFQKYIEVENLDGENQYDAGNEHGKQDAKKGVIFTKFPPVLTIHLKRFDFDFESMGFKKIHDNFEFPTVLDVGKYLADDIEVEDGEDLRGPPQSHRYLLHSVLVHAGDVGGGHYYAYIRPGTEANYQQVYAHTVDNAVRTAMPAVDASFFDKPPAASSLAPRNPAEEGQFYKFNDELVSAVSLKEAVEACYGRRVSTYLKEVAHTMNSAYMLVYIRREDARHIMTPITPEDIPASLMQRLEEEQRKRKQAQAKLTHQKRYSNIHYAMETHIAHFSAYTKAQYFINTPQMQSMQVMVDSTRLGVLLRIAEVLEKSPMLLKLWRIGYRVRDAAPNDPLVVQDDFSTKELSATIDETHFFVQNVKLSRAELQPFVEQFQMEFQILKEKETLWLQRIEAALKMYTDWYEIGLPLDPCYGCGIGMSNKILEELKLYDNELYEVLVKEIATLTMQTHNLLLEFDLEYLETKTAAAKSTSAMDVEVEDKSEKALVFFKVFDPYDMLSLAPLPGAKIAQDMTTPEIQPSTQQDTAASSAGVYNIVNNFTAEDAGITAFNQMIQQLAAATSDGSQTGAMEEKTVEFYTEKKSERAYMPLKYLSYLAVEPDESVRWLYGAALKLLKRNCEEVDSASLELWTQPANIQLHYYHTAMKVVPVLPFSADNSPNTIYSLFAEKDKDDKDVNLSLVVILSIKPNLYLPTLVEPKLVKQLEQPELWCRYFVNQRRFYVQPMGPAELRGLYNQHLIQQAELHRQQFNDNGFPLIRKRGLDNEQDKEAAATNTTIRIKSGIETTISVLHTLPEVVEMVAKELQVDPRHLVLYLVPMYLDPVTQQPPGGAADPYDSAKDSASPITIYGSLAGDPRYPRINHETLLQFFTRHKYNQARFYNTFLFLYQLLPYPVQVPTRLLDDEEEGKDEEGAREMKTNEGEAAELAKQSDDRIVEVLLGDDYLRQRRKRYLDHVFQEQLRLYQLRDVLLQEVSEDVVMQSSSKRRKTLTWGQTNAAEGKTNSGVLSAEDYFKEDEPCLVDMKFPLNPYHILESHRMLIKMPANAEVHDLLRYVRNTLNIPVDYTASSPSNAADKEAETQLHILGRSHHVNLVSERAPAGSDGVATTSGDMLPSVSLALHSLHQGMLINTIGSNHVLSEFPATWCEPLYPSKTPHRMVLQSMPRAALPLIAQQHPSCRSMAVAVFNFTLLGNIVQQCEPTAFFPPFVIYVREDDTYSSLLDRLIEISGDRSLAFCRISVVERSAVPTFIPRTSGNGSLLRSNSTHISSAESVQSLESCSTPNNALSDREDDTENESPSPVPNTASKNTPAVAAGPTVWSYFADKYPQHASHDIFDAVDACRRGVSSRHMVSLTYAWLGVQRATADLQQATQLKRSKRSNASIGIKINK